MAGEIVVADAWEYMGGLRDESVDCCVTSPPYFGLRDYGIDGQIGIEQSLAEYIGNLASIFIEVRRALKPTGTLWVNIGDSYSGHRPRKAGASAGLNGRTQQHARDVMAARSNYRNSDMPEKNLLLVPERLAIALQERGWVLRSKVIWVKPNAMPNSVKDRPSSSYETVLMLVKSRHYHYDYEASLETALYDGRKALRSQGSAKYGDAAEMIGGKVHTMAANGGARWQERDGQMMRAMRDVWVIPTEPSRELHYAPMPSRLAERCIRVGCPKGGTVLDPFMGSGTTALVARRMGRQYLGCDLNPDYVALAQRRLAQPYTAEMF